MDIFGKIIIDIVIFFLNSVGKAVTRARQNNCVNHVVIFYGCICQRKSFKYVNSRNLGVTENVYVDPL